MTNRDKPLAEDDWPVGWTEQRADLLARMRAASPAQRLAWLEEMIALAFGTGALPRPDADRREGLAPQRAPKTLKDLLPDISVAGEGADDRPGH